MRSLFKNLSLVPAKLRDKLITAFSLMSVIPLLILGYLAVTYIFPHNRDIGTVSYIIAMGVLIAFLGFSLAVSIIKPIIKLSADARRMADGDMTGSIAVDREDEVGVIEDSLNKITDKVRENMESLSSYGKEIGKLNLKINDNILAMQSLLQVGSIISKSTRITDVLELIMSKLSDLPFVGTAAIFMKDEDTGQLKIKASVNYDKDIALHHAAVQLFDDAMASAKPMVFDKGVHGQHAVNEFKDIYGVENFVLSPLFLQGYVIGLIFTGNALKDFTYDKEDISMLQIFVRQLNIAIENDILSRKAEALQVKDELTGLFNRKYIESQLDEEIKRAIMYQRPCSFAMFDIDDFLKFKDAHGGALSAGVIKSIAVNLKEMATDVDKIGRLEPDMFAIILPEKNKREALMLAENIAKKVSGMKFEVSMGRKASLTISGGVSENPIDGVSAKELISHAMQSVKKAKLQGKNKILG